MSWFIMFASWVLPGIFFYNFFNLCSPIFADILEEETESSGYRVTSKNLGHGVTFWKDATNMIPNDKVVFKS